MLMQTIDLKDSTIRELRTEVMSKSQKIENLKLRVRILEQDILEFTNEFQKNKFAASKKSVSITA